MQEQLIDKCRWLAKEVGINSSEGKGQNAGKEKNNNKPPKGKKKPPPSPIPEDVEQGPPTPAPRDRSPSTGKLRSRSNSINSITSSPVKSNTLALPQNSNLPESRAPSPFVPSNCSTPIPGSLDDADWGIGSRRDPQFNQKLNLACMQKAYWAFFRGLHSLDNDHKI